MTTPLFYAIIFLKYSKTYHDLRNGKGLNSLDYSFKEIIELHEKEIQDIEQRNYDFLQELARIDYEEALLEEEENDIE